ncbi:MAG: acyl-CoA dehydrogenase family protein [Alphaproteobacteria bacterium]|nr:acyl-CoA dehydrogenase family protein [Alphaproteobacteria bacterium]
MSNPKGLEWLITTSSFEDVFIPEEFNEEHLQIKDLATQFLQKEVVPNFDKIECKEDNIMANILKKAGDVGLLGSAVPEEFEGLGKDFVTTSIINESLGAGYSFSVAYAAHTGIGTLPILFFGTENQKQKYVPKLASGQLMGAYGLTEPTSGSDALSAKTTAVLSADKKHYILNGQKCWITNGGFADIYTVFAKIDGTKFTAFIIERGMPGFTQGLEEHKMGIKGSSTVQLYFQDCLVPVENVLGDIGRGHIIAFNILNIGRLKLCIATLGAAKGAAKESAQYANTRQQFKLPLATFGAIKFKISEMVIKIWMIESLSYRIAHNVDIKEKQFIQDGKTFNEASLGAAEEFAVECSIAKVAGSEMLNYVVDEGVQIHGGNGFSDEYLISRAYRDSRINRIFEGTNEINRLLIFDMIIKRALAGKIDLLTAAKKIQNDLLGIPDFSIKNQIDLFENLKNTLENYKKAILLVAGAATQKLNEKIATEQELIMNISDMIIETYICESGLLRLLKLNSKKTVDIQIENRIVETYFYDVSFKIAKYGQDAINIFASGDEQKMMLLALKRFTKCDPINPKESRRIIAKDFLQKQGSN